MLLTFKHTIVGALAYLQTRLLHAYYSLAVTWILSLFLSITFYYIYIDVLNCTVYIFTVLFTLHKWSYLCVITGLILKYYGFVRSILWRYFYVLVIVLAYASVQYYLLTNYFWMARTEDYYYLYTDSYFFYTFMATILCIYSIGIYPYLSFPLLVEARNWLTSPSVKQDPDVMVLDISDRGPHIILAVASVLLFILRMHILGSAGIVHCDSEVDSSTSMYFDYADPIDYKSMTSAQSTLNNILSTYEQIAATGQLKDRALDSADIALASSVVEFIKDNLSHLLSSATNHSGIPIDYFDNLDLQKHIDLKDTWRELRLPNNACTYALYNPKTEDLYIGSATDLDSRIRAHYGTLEASSPHKLYVSANNDGGFEGWKLYVPYSTSNYYYAFTEWYTNLEEHPVLSMDQLSQLRKVFNLFTQFEVRSVEQTLKTELSPSLNGAGDIGFYHNWEFGDQENSVGKETFATSKHTGKVYGPYSSIYDAETSLKGPDARNISASYNCYNYHTIFGDTDQEDLVRFHGPNAFIKPSMYANKELHPSIDMEQVVKGPVFAVDRNFVVKEIYDSLTDAYDKSNCKNGWTSFKNHKNTGWIAASLVLGGITTSLDLMYVRHPDVTSKHGYKLTNTTTGDVTFCSSFSHASDRFFALSGIRLDRWTLSDWAGKGGTRHKYTFAKVTATSPESVALLGKSIRV